MEFNLDFAVGDNDLGLHVDEVPEDLASLGVPAAAHSTGHDTIEPAGENQEGRVEVHLEANGRRERIDVEEPYRVGESFFR